MVLWSTVLLPFNSGYSFSVFPQEVMSIMFQLKFVDKIFGSPHLLAKDCIVKSLDICF